MVRGPRRAIPGTLAFVRMPAALVAMVLVASRLEVAS